MRKSCALSLLFPTTEIPLFEWLAIFVGMPLLYLLTGVLNRILSLAAGIENQLGGCSRVNTAEDNRGRILSLRGRLSLAHEVAMLRFTRPEAFVASFHLLDLVNHCRAFVRIAPK
jgi:hypothetical protein